MTRALYLSGAAMVSLALGTLVYLLERPVTFLPVSFSVDTLFLGLAAGWLPSLTHAFAFSLLSALAFGVSRRAAALSCLLWAGLGAAFEIGQHAAVAAWLEHAGLGLAYFERGTFDPLDLAASVAGAVLAFGLLTLFRRNAHA